MGVDNEKEDGGLTRRTQEGLEPAGRGRGGRLRLIDGWFCLVGFSHGVVSMVNGMRKRKEREVPGVIFPVDRPPLVSVSGRG